MKIEAPDMATQSQTPVGRLPEPGCWSDDDYLSLTDQTNRLVELSDGFIEELPMPTDLHQTIVQYLFMALLGFVGRSGGKVHFAPIRLRIRRGKFREPDILLGKNARDSRRRNRYWIGADLTVEVVSPEKPERDLVEKRIDYAEGGIPEYWIVNPQAETITVLRLEGGSYVEHGIFRRGELATSVILAGFSVVVNDLFNEDAPPDVSDDAD